MTPEQEAELIEKMCAAADPDLFGDKIAKWEGERESVRRDMRAALSIAKPIIRDEAFEDAAKMVNESYEGACYEGISRFISADIRALKSQGQKPS